MIVTVVNGLIDIISFILLSLVALLPETPFKFEKVEWGAWGKAVGAFFPIADMATHFTLILTAITLYYVVRWGLRVVRAIR